MNKPAPGEMTGDRISLRWLFLMAWRDSRKNRPRLFLFMSSITVGIAALVAMYSFGYNLEQDIDREAKTLTGADLIIESNRPVTTEVEEMLHSIDGERARETSFASMIYFPATQGTRLVQVRAIEGSYPFYGTIETTPKDAARQYQEGSFALVDKTLMLQFNAKNGDSIRIGELSFLILGTVDKAPGRTGFATSVAPAVFIPGSQLSQTGLLQKGSRVNYKSYFRFAGQEQTRQVIDAIVPPLEELGVDVETVESTKRNTGRSFEDFTQFLTLISFIALLLGCMGVASAVHIYVREKLQSVAILRCLGVTGRQAFLIYLIQIAVIGLLGSLIGAFLGSALQFALPAVLKDFLPVDVQMTISWPAIVQGTVVGLMISVLAALLPLVSVRHISPLNTLRVTPGKDGGKGDPLRWFIYFLSLVFIFVFSWLQMDKWQSALFFTVGVLGAFLILAGVGSLLMWTIKRLLRDNWSYLWRQGFSNLFRPNNQTIVLIVAIGLGTSFICTLYIVQDLLIRRVTLSASSNQPNMVLFDIQDGEKDEVALITRQFGLPVIQEVPIVNMRIEEINGITAEDARRDSTLDVSQRVFESELRVTYRDTLTASEKLTAGSLNRRGSADTVYISLEERYADRLNVDIGDRIVFNVQGSRVQTIVGSFREVDWNRVQTNFRVVFSSGVLEGAPKFHVLMTRVPSNEVSAAFQRELVKRFPTISVIDLGLILRVMDDVLDKIGFVIRFMGGFGIATGLMVLIASIMISKYQRVRESVLLRTLGASGRQILVITALEYFFLGFLAAVTGLLLAIAAGWALARFSFDMTFTPSILPLIVIVVAVTVLTVVIGMFNSRDVLRNTPMEVLRNDS